MNKLSSDDFAERTLRLIRKPLKFNAEKGTVSEPNTNSKKKIIGTHGTHTDTVVRFARNKKFIGGTALLDGRFFLSANMEYPEWGNTEIGRDLLGSDYPAISSFQMGAYYAETATGYDYVEELDEMQLPNTHNMVIIGFNALTLKIDGINLGLSNDVDGGAELDLPKSPGIECIHGIYPVGDIAATALNAALAELSS